MTEEVAALVLKDNDSQARALTLDGLRSVARYEEFVALVEDLVAQGVLSRADDAIPTREELLASPQRERGLPRPLLAVVLGHTKMSAFEKLLETDFPDSASGRPFLDAYFPRRLRESYAAYFPEHVLRREIIATAAVNHVVNCAGVAFLARMMATTKAGLGQVVTAYVDVDRESGAEELRSRLEQAGLPAHAEHEGLLEIEGVLEALTRQVLEGGKAKAEGALKDVARRLEFA
jgi:glutamate dehydrogenase